MSKMSESELTGWKDKQDYKNDEILSFKEQVFNNQKILKII